MAGVELLGGHEKGLGIEVLHIEKLLCFENYINCLAHICKYSVGILIISTIFNSDKSVNFNLCLLESID